MNAIRAAEISSNTLTEEADEATNLEDFSSDKEKSAVVGKGKAAKASKTDTTLKKSLIVTSASKQNILKKSRIRETPTLSTDADSRTDTNLKRLRDLSLK